MGIKYNVNRDFFKIWTSEMSYVLGFIVADGSLEDAPYLRGRYLRVYSSDMEILTKIKTLMDSQHFIVVTKPKDFLSRGKKYTCKEKYMLRIGSHEIYNDLIALGITPNKSKTIQFLNVPSGFLSCFIRGYLDGDGCIYYYKKQERLVVVFTSGSKEFLQGLSHAINAQYGLNKHKIIYNNGAFQLRYSTRESTILLRQVYAPPLNCLFLSRKYKVYLNFIKGHSKWRLYKLDGAVGKWQANCLQNSYSAVRIRSAPLIEEVFA